MSKIRDVLVQLEQSAFIDGQFPIKETTIEMHKSKNVEKITPDQALSQIHKIISDSLPEKQFPVKGEHEEDIYIFYNGYNQAIDQVKKILDELLKGE